MTAPITDVSQIAPTASMPSPNLFPIALHVEGRRCVIVGGGAVAERKAVALFECGAHLVIVAPDLVSPVLHDWAHNQTVRYIAAPFSPNHLTGAFLCVAATDNPAVNEAVLHAAREQNVLCNLAAPISHAGAGDETDVAEAETNGDFVTMASVRRGDLLLAVTTGGAGPALSALIKRDLEASFGPEWEPYTRLLREMRGVVKTRFTHDEAARAKALRKLANADTVREKLAVGDESGARAEALACL